MFETGSQMAEYGNGARRRRRLGGEEEYGYGQGEEEYGYGQGEEEYGYGQGEEEYGYGQGEEEYGYGQGEEEYGYGQGEERVRLRQGEKRVRLRPGRRGVRLRPRRGGVRLRRGRGGAVPARLADPDHRQGARRAARRRRSARREVGGYGQGEDGVRADEARPARPRSSSCTRSCSSVLGREAEYNEAPLTPAQEAEFAERLLEVSNEEELARVLGGIVNTVGRAVQGISGAVELAAGPGDHRRRRPAGRGGAHGRGRGPAARRPSRASSTRRSEQFEAARRSSS